MVCKIKNTLFEDIKKVTIYGKTVFPSGLLAEFFIAMFVRKWMSILQMYRTQMELYTFLQSPLCWPFFWSCTESKKRHQFVHHLWLFWPCDGLYPGAVFFFVMWNDPIMYTVKIQLYNKWGFQSTFCCCSFCISQVIFLFLTDARKVDIPVVYVGEVCTCSWTLNSSYVWLMKMISRIHTQHSSSQTKIA